MLFAAQRVLSFGADMAMVEKPGRLGSFDGPAGGSDGYAADGLRVGRLVNGYIGMAGELDVQKSLAAQRHHCLDGHRLRDLTMSHENRLQQ